MNDTSLILSIGTITVSVVALVITFINNERQRKTLIATTVEKEWQNSIQQHLSSVMHLAQTYVTHRKSLSLSFDEETANNGIAVMFEFLSRIYSLKLLLNKERPFQAEVLQAIDLLADEVNKHGYADTDKIAMLNESIIDAAHKLLESRRVK
jgi:hypothetical protein